MEAHPLFGLVTDKELGLDPRRPEIKFLEGQWTDQMF
jgi:hypothetical protein